uniref:Family with sequence similarity 117 member Ab n=1 Tax=Tetraodon nigroviridis TaxID=99883 RepID=H3DNL5_TETNG
SSGMRRTMSLDAIIGPYLQGQWPKEPESSSHKDKSTQTPASWADESHSRKGSSGSHKRSASWGSAENLREIAKLKQQLQRSKAAVSGGADKDCQQGYPQGACSLGTTQVPRASTIPLAPLSTLVPPLRCSVEGLNQELEGMFICQPPHPQHRVTIAQLLEVPDGHRAPIPPQSCSSGSQSDAATTPQSTPSSPSPPLTYICSLSPSSEGLPPDAHQGLVEEIKECEEVFKSASLLLLSSSPGPNKSSCFQREPPEGCERVRVWEETSPLEKPKPAVISSCPDPNKINFTPHGGSAFCPVSLLKPLLPSVDL